MSWPLISDFSRMLQTPKVAFRDTSLRECSVEKDNLGQPKARSGNFATVFKGFRPDGSSFAIRVFNRQADTRRERYQEVSRYLEDLAVSSLVRFEYDERGIRSASDGKLYPLLTMEWVPGVTLFEWARDRCREGYQEALAIGAEVWLQLVRELAGSSVVHGDLQHANVLVSNEGHFKLVDYDCMCVPQLLNQPNVELGMEPYQHPQRQMGTPMFPGLDNFSALVIYVALRALAAAPNLWITYVDGPGYDKLLFRKEDFQAPNQSHLYYELMNSPDEQVRDLTHYQFELLKYNLYDIPPIDEVLLWCNSLDQLLSARDWDTAVELVKHMSRNEQIPAHLQPLVDQAHRRVACREGLEEALASGDEYLVQQRYVPDLLDDYPAAAPLVEQARQAGQVRQVLEVLRAAHRFQRWDLFRETWSANEEFLDKRPSAKEFKPEIKKLRTADLLRKLLEDPNSDDQAVTDAWDYLKSVGGHPLADPLAPAVEGRNVRQKALATVRDLIEHAPETPTLSHDRRVIEAWHKEYFKGWTRIANIREHYRAALLRAKGVKEIHKLAKTCSLDGERTIASRHRELPPGYHAQMGRRGELAVRRLAAYSRLQHAIQDAASESGIAEAWRTLEEVKGHNLANEHDRSRVDLALSRMAKIEALGQMSEFLAPQQVDQEILQIWDEALLRDCPDAQPWRPQYEQAKQRHDVIQRIKEAIEKADQAAIDELRHHPCLSKYPLPPEVAQGIDEMAARAEQTRLAKRQAMIAALMNTRRKEFRELFEADTVRSVCEQFAHHRPLVNQWIGTEILPLGQSGLAAVEEGGLEKVSDTHYRARWVWPPAHFANRCRLIVCREKPQPHTNLSDFESHLSVTIERTVWEIAGGCRDFGVEEEWEGSYVMVWAVVDLGYQTFDTEPLEIGRLEAEQKPQKRWSLFGRGRAD